MGDHLFCKLVGWRFNKDRNTYFPNRPLHAEIPSWKMHKNKTPVWDSRVGCQRGGWWIFLYGLTMILHDVPTLSPMFFEKISGFCPSVTPPLDPPSPFARTGRQPRTSFLFLQNAGKWRSQNTHPDFFRKKNHGAAGREKHHHFQKHVFFQTSFFRGHVGW